MFIDNKNFYPTPEHLIKKMLLGLDFKYVTSILEPQAGKGNIVDELKNIESKQNVYQKKVSFDIDCIEIDTNLQHILKGKNYRVVHNDFLTYNTLKEYDLIIMNPPFDNGAKHLLKALEMQKRNGGSIICLLNAETLKNQCNNERVSLGRLLEDYNATIEFLSDGFTTAERKTPVEIAFVKVQLPSVEKESFIFEGLRKSKAESECSFTEECYPAESDLFKAIVSQYELEIAAGIKLIKEYHAMYPLIMREFDKNSSTGETIQKGGCILSMDLSTNRDKYQNALTINSYIKEVRGKYWNALFKNPKFIGHLTNNLQQDFYNRLEELKNYDFSLYNIYQLKIDMNSSVVKGVEDTIIALFDELSHKHHYYDETSRNIHYYNGWKTNKSYLINKKVIIPLCGFDNMWDRYSPTNYKIVEKLKDIEKCFNYLDGGLTDSVNIEESLKFAEEYCETKDIQLKFFTITFYKKGTCHITFNNEELLKKFNIFGSQQKGWLPPSYGKKAYKDMNNEEKEVVNQFEGELSYNNVLNNSNYYLFDRNTLKMIEDTKTA